MKNDSKLTVDDDLVLKSNRIVIPSDLQNHFIPLAHWGYLGTVKTKWLLRRKVCFTILGELVEKLSTSKCK